ncbi:MAG: S8 family peptidase [Thermofilaceae archaeon]
MKKAWISCIVLTVLLVVFLVPSANTQKKVRVVVGFEDENALVEILNLPGAEKVKIIPEIKVMVLYLPEGIFNNFRRGKGLRYIENDGIAYTLEFSSSDILWNVKMINTDKVWNTYFPQMGWSALGRGVVVAVLDTGVDYNHPELKSRLAWCAYTLGTRTYTGTNLKNCADGNGHGTHVTGIIASAINGVGNAGVAPNVTIYVVKVLSNSGSGTYSDIAEGIILAVKGPDGIVGTSDDAKILSMSLGGSSDNSVLRDAVSWAYSNGAVIVAAAGNSGDGNPSTNNVAYPAKYSQVIAVAAVDSSGNVPSWSSDGVEVDVAAPGVNIYSTYKNSGYATASGTSMATPHVSATIALIQALRLAQGKAPFTFNQVYETLTRTTKDVSSPGFDVFSGYGLIDGLAAIEYALNQP